SRPFAENREPCTVHSILAPFPARYIHYCPDPAPKAPAYHHAREVTPPPPPPRPPTVEESRQRIRAALLDAKRVAVGTHAGEEVRVRMMHPGAWLPDDEAARPIVYLASMKSDPKIRELQTRPEIALLLHESPTRE